ncbi:MAG: AMP-binding protein [Alphaproteobacteria bacterium]|nr:AMP-binding protein [Alphaproteobacteria bacterium]
MTLHATLENSAKAFADRCWLCFEDATWSYAEGNALCEKIARGLVEQSVRPGDRVGLLFTNSPELVFCYFACFKAGAVAVPLNTRFQAAESIYALNHCGTKILVGQSDLIAPLLEARNQMTGLEHIFATGGALPGTQSFSALIREVEVALPAVTNGQLAVILYTSGTTSRPKGVMHSHATLLRQNANYLEVLGVDAYERCLVSLPLCHIAALSIWLLAGTEAGGTMTLLSRFEPGAVVHAIARDRITFAGGLPVMINALINHPDAASHDLSSLKVFMGGGDCVPLEMQKRFHQVFGVHVDELCGMTEVIYCNQPVNLGQRRAGSIGKPFGDVRIRLEDADGNEMPDGEVGEIVAYSGAVTLGYWNDPENTRAALRGGGMHSGDLARRDADGFLWFAGRAKDIIIRGGSNISPGEVEDALYTHPAVYEAGVVGVPCRELGQRVRAYVALKPGARATDKELIDWAAKNIAAYKVPESIEFLPALPKGLTGKVLRKALRDQTSLV